MYAPERQQRIVEILQAEHRVGVQQLAREFDISRETVRRDLAELEAHGLVRRTHGGAVSVGRLSFSAPVTDRESVYSREKQEIALAALELIEEDSSIAIDAGTTTIALAQAIPVHWRLTVVTSSLIVGTTLAAHPHVKLHLLGGEVRPNSRSAAGPDTIEQISSYTLDWAFISADGISAQHGMTTHNFDEALVKRRLMRVARRSAVLADRSKFGAQEFGRIGPLEDADVVVTDSGVDPETADSIRSAGLDVRIA